MTGMLSCQFMVILSWLLASEEREGDAVLEEERNRSERVAWGTGRVVVRANLRAIQGLLDEGWPLTTVYQRVKNSLAGVSYRQFSEHVRRHLRSTSKQPTKKQAPTQSNVLAQTTSIVESSAQRGSANGEKPQTPEQTATIARRDESQTKKITSTSAFRGFEPGPKVPDLKDLF